MTYGDVAQLGERGVRIAEARGSIPLISTIFRNIRGLPRFPRDLPVKRRVDTQSVSTHSPKLVNF